jgi:hypothetical protein
MRYADSNREWTRMDANRKISRKAAKAQWKDNQPQICADEEVGIGAKRPAVFRLTPIGVSLRGRIRAPVAATVHEA